MLVAGKVAGDVANFTVHGHFVPATENNARVAACSADFGANLGVGGLISRSIYKLQPISLHEML